MQKIDPELIANADKERWSTALKTITLRMQEVAEQIELLGKEFRRLNTILATVKPWDDETISEILSEIIEESDTP